MTRAYAQKLDASFLSPFKFESPNWGPVGYVTMKRTYPRKIDDSCECTIGLNPDCPATTHRVEDWWELCKRCVEFLGLRGAFTKEELETLYIYWFRLKGMGAGRHLWQLGTRAVERIGADSLQNCWFVAAQELRAFVFTMDQLMLGGGVGFSVQGRHVWKLPPVKFSPVIQRVETFDCDFIVPDNREGWCRLLEQVFESFFTHGRPLRYNVRNLRAKGTRIKTFGGTASGGEILVECIQNIATVIRAAHGRQLTSIECLDIFNLIAHCVVAGNVRRSAQIAIGDCFDQKFLDAKQWQKGNVPNWRARSNNSTACDEFRSLLESFWDNYNGEGEPTGLVNVGLLKSHGRLIDGIGYRPDSKVEGVNPCGEIGLEPYESCLLLETFLPNVTPDEFHVIAGLLCKAGKTVSCIPHAQPETRAIVDRNHRMGIGVTGYLQSDYVGDYRLFDSVYRHIEKTDREYSKLMGVSPSNKLTTVKPSGTLSLLPGCTSGCHPEFGRFFIRRIEFAANNPLLDLCRDHGFWIEPKLNNDGSRDLRTMVVEFPCKAANENTPIASELTAIQQMEHQEFLQTWWADNAVSCTVVYSIEELEAIKRRLRERYDSSVKTICFLLRGDESGFKQMPFEEIDKEEYLALEAQMKPIRSELEMGLTGDDASSDCKGGTCPVK